MSTTANSYFFRRRTMGRAASPPTWACYEQIPCDGDEDSDSGSDSCSEDEDEYPRIIAGHEPMSDSDEVDRTKGDNKVDNIHDIDMDMEEEGIDAGADKKVDSQRDVKGKQRAIDPEPESKKHHHRRKKEHPPVYTLRPILTIQKSQGFVWNQDLFVPPYIKDRYVASTSPPNSKGFISTPASSANSALPDYEVEVVEIRVNEGDLDYLRP